jgi:hypothetical protein
VRLGGTECYQYSAGRPHPPGRARPAQHIHLNGMIMQAAAWLPHNTNATDARIKAALALIDTF